MSILYTTQSEKPFAAELADLKEFAGVEAIKPADKDEASFTTSTGANRLEVNFAKKQIKTFAGLEMIGNITYR